MSILPSNLSWSITPYENENASTHTAHVERWISSGDRHDYAEVRLEPPLLPSESGVPEVLERVILAARFAGETLVPRPSRPVHVYVLTPKLGTRSTDTISPNDLAIRLWAIVNTPASELT